MLLLILSLLHKCSMVAQLLLEGELMQTNEFNSPAKDYGHNVICSVHT